MQKAQFHNPLNQISGHDHYHQAFSYDGLNRLTSADYGIDSLSASSYFDVAGITYDAAGNIQTLQRDDDSGSLLDDLSYHYAAGTNRLDSLYDAAGGQTTWDATTVGSCFTYGVVPCVQRILYTCITLGTINTNTTLMPLTVRLPEDLEKRLDELAKLTGRTKTYYVKEALEDKLTELEDLYITEYRLEHPEGPRWSLEQLERGQDVEG